MTCFEEDKNCQHQHQNEQVIVENIIINEREKTNIVIITIILNIITERNTKSPSRSLIQISASMFISYSYFVCNCLLFSSYLFSIKFVVFDFFWLNHMVCPGQHCQNQYMLHLRHPNHYHQPKHSCHCQCIIVTLVSISISISISMIMMTIMIRIDQWSALWPKQVGRSRS